MNVIAIVTVAGLTLFFLALLYQGARAVIQLARLQMAVMKHRASAGTWDDDDALYRAAGFEPVTRLFRREDSGR